MWPKILFGLWFIAISIPLSMMMGGHQLSLKPSKNSSLVALTDKTESRWKILHFLNPECGCSQNVVNKLLERKAKNIEVSETAFILGSHAEWEKSLKKAGFKVVSGKMDEFSKKYQINAVPQLVIIREDKILYTGGYSTKRGPASVVEDETIFKELVTKNETAERPIYGCVSGSENQKLVDPIGAKYKRKL